jgi:uncharacterized membrane protein
MNARAAGVRRPTKARASRRQRSEHHGRAAWRLAITAAIGSAVGVAAVVVGARWPIAASIGWDGAAAFFLVWTWVTIIGHNPSETADLARKEDASRAAADAFLLGACVASLIAVGYVLVEAGRQHGGPKVLLIALAVSSVSLAWLAIHTVFALRYARMYYASDPPRGFDFHESAQPDYRDFAYVALTIGMTFQVSDTDLTTKPVRHAAVRHAMISFVFGAVIVAVTINIVGSLLSK